MERVIGSIRRYLGIDHLGLTGRRVVIVAVLRATSADEQEILHDDALIGPVRADDVMEFAPLIRDDGPPLPPGIAVIEPAAGLRTERIERASWVTSDGSPGKFEPSIR